MKKLEQELKKVKIQGEFSKKRKIIFVTSKEITKDIHKEILIPTPILIDSVAMMIPRGDALKDGEHGTQMSAAQVGKHNSEMVKNLAPTSFDASLIPIFY